MTRRLCNVYTSFTTESFTNYNSIPPIPYRAEVGLPATIPMALVGTVDEEPGEWAQLVMQMNFKVARAGELLKTDNLKLLHGRPQLRELTIRVKNWSPLKLYDQICQKARHVEAAAMQIVGNYDREVSCDDCKKFNRPFPKCITFPGILGCGNCHWHDHGPSCSRNPDPVPRTRAHRSRPSDTSNTSQENAGNRDRVRDLIVEAINGHARIRQVQAEITQLMVGGGAYTPDFVTKSMELATLHESHENKFLLIQELL